VRVTSGQPPAPRRTPRTAALEIDAQSEIGAIYVRSLLRAQLRLAARILGALALLAGGLPLAFWLWPGATSTTILGFPVSWAILGLGIYPVLCLLGWVFIREAERNERSFHDVVDE
jgi:hypothetical protein